eukprot:CAMPEP_0182574472 /NCGR_PEP_ID=MMETSP1324-20130603/25466_1 /TAXON_ID=236786 /ORGANISM="Florenciella sp., Strain RCC1587" /LENGTH=114 /DNA_ID=CAMNT_0024789849 /DNA_START=42 /DNA_END=386 /DNA_ORIENTATION=-
MSRFNQISLMLDLAAARSLPGSKGCGILSRRVSPNVASLLVNGNSQLPAAAAASPEAHIGSPDYKTFSGHATSAALFPTRVTASSPFRAYSTQRTVVLGVSALGFSMPVRDVQH